MSLINCEFKCRNVAAALFLSAIIGIVTAFLQITGTITVTTAFLWVVFGIGVVGIGVFVLAAALSRTSEACPCRYTALITALAGLLGSILLAVILLALGITATSIVDAILVGLLLFFFVLALTGAASYVVYLERQAE